MTSLSDIELLRARWRRTLASHALDTTQRDDFGHGPLAQRLKSVSAQVLLQPKDPDSIALELDDNLWAWLDQHTKVDLAGRTLRFGDRRLPTAHAATMADRSSHEPWQHYLAVHRSGTSRPSARA